MKKLLKIFIITLSIILIKLVLIFSINELIIYNYNHNRYNKILIKTLYIFNFNESYIAYYNEGNILYKKENYEEASKLYKKAIDKNPPLDKVCDIRINLTLSMLKQIDTTDKKIAYNELEDAKDNLYNNNCASPIVRSGYSQSAEDLEEEIKELQNNLSSNLDNNNQSDDDKDDEVEDDEDYSDIEQTLKEIEKEANSNRQKDLDNYENMGSYSYYSGKKW